MLTVNELDVYYRNVAANDMSHYKDAKMRFPNSTAFQWYIIGVGLDQQRSGCDATMPPPPTLPTLSTGTCNLSKTALVEPGPTLPTFLSSLRKPCMSLLDDFTEFGIHTVEDLDIFYQSLRVPDIDLIDDKKAKKHFPNITSFEWTLIDIGLDRRRFGCDTIMSDL